MATWSNVDCAEVRGTATSAIGNNGVQASVTLQCAWANRIALAQDLLQFRRFWPYAIGAGAPRVANITAIRGWGESSEDPTSSGQLFIWSDAQLDVEYEPLAATVPTQPASYDLVLETIEGEAEGKRLAETGFQWKTSGPRSNPALFDGEAPLYQTYPLRLTREYIGINSLPAAIYDLVGQVNDAPYVSSILGRTFDPETLKLNYPYASRTLRTDGSDGWNLQLSMSYRSEGHNVFWRQDGDSGGGIFRGAFERITADGTSDYIQYPLADFSPLFV